MAAPENTPPEVEAQHHRYRGSKIPWYVHLNAIHSYPRSTEDLDVLYRSVAAAKVVSAVL